MKAIVHVVYDCVPGAYAGGVQKMVFELASAQRRAGADVEVWAVNALRAGATEDHGGLTLRYFMPDDALGLVKSDRLEAHLRALPPGHVLHAHNSFHPLNLQVGEAGAARGFPVYYHPHGALDPSLFQGWSWRALKKRLYIRFVGRLDLNRSAGVFALTGNEEAQLRSLGVTAPVAVIPNGVAAAESAEVPPAESARRAAAFRAAHGLPATAKVLLFIGRINPKKRLEDIIAAFAELAPREPDLHLILAGQADAAYSRVLRAMVDRTGLAARVRWVGFLDETAKPGGLRRRRLLRPCVRLGGHGLGDPRGDGPGFAGGRHRGLLHADGGGARRAARVRARRRGPGRGVGTPAGRSRRGAGAGRGGASLHPGGA